MKKQILLYVSALFLVFTACDDKGVDPVMQDASANKSTSRVVNLRAHLSGDQEVPAVETNATGQAIFQLSKDGTELHYKLMVANIENVRMAHIHMAPAGTNGGVVVWLYPDGPPPVLIPGRFSGILAEGTITAANLQGALAGSSLSDLVNLMIDGQTYVNVHTLQYGGGEIRGQVKSNAVLDPW
ncbi:CHRD domain-containing protein [Cesiribacter sp. SM1]|uniref:CHRD domain-containing protein n=1 Tax=Cesiribacter sp. SM1 TaxID=2861196 RepID=UPI001CD46170|nr:CHRD domain-containing protein [Cesiribacter sp. SM1]